MTLPARLSNPWLCPPRVAHAGPAWLLCDVRAPAAPVGPASSL